MNLLNAQAYIQRFLKIRTKEGAVVPLVLNKPQARLYQAIQQQWQAGKPVRIIILKARQMGFSTLTEAVIFFLTVTARYVESMIVAHKDEATANLFRMSKRFYDELPAEIKPMQRSSNAQELLFDRPARYKGQARGLGSRIRCATAGGSGVGRSYTLKCLHLSEFAFWPGDKRDTFSGLVQAVPDLPGTVIIIESTANGYDEFKHMWDDAVQAQRDGTDGFTPVFFPWFEMEEYRREPLPSFQRTAEEQELARTFGLDDRQLAWRRWCISVNCGGDVNLFHQEYPATPDEAFIATGRCAFDKAALVLRREQVRKQLWERGMFQVQKGLDGKIIRWTWKPEEQGPLRIRKHPELEATSSPPTFWTTGRASRWRCSTTSSGSGCLPSRSTAWVCTTTRLWWASRPTTPPTRRWYWKNWATGICTSGSGWTTSLESWWTPSDSRPPRPHAPPSWTA